MKHPWNNLLWPFLFLSGIIGFFEMNFIVKRCRELRLPVNAQRYPEAEHVHVDELRSNN